MLCDRYVREEMLRERLLLLQLLLLSVSLLLYVLRLRWLIWQRLCLCVHLLLLWWLHVRGGR